jgi:hypothetical protein
MVRPVRRDDQAIVCHLVREVRDSSRARLSYQDEVAQVVFIRDRRPGASPGAGELSVTVNIDAVPQREHPEVYAVLDSIREQFARHSRYVTGDKMRAMLRVYIESLLAIRVRATGGVYFVHRHHQDTLDALRVLVKRFGGGSALYPIPLPDQEEMREMVISAFRQKATQDLQRLASDIAAAQGKAADRGGSVTAAAAEALYDRFRALQAEAGQHSELLNTDLADTSAAMNLVSTQIAALLAAAG